MFRCSLEQQSGNAAEYTRDPGFRLLPLPLPSSVTLGKFLNFSVPRAAHLLTRDSMAIVRNKQFMYITH